MRFKKIERITAIILTAVMLIGLFPTVAMASEIPPTAVPIGDKWIVDADDDVSPNFKADDLENGQVWTDKSVAYTGGDKFDITLSAIGRRIDMSEETYLELYKPMNVVFVLDISGSMSSGSLEAMLTATRNAGKMIVEANEKNSVAVVYYNREASQPSNVNVWVNKENYPTTLDTLTDNPGTLDYTNITAGLNLANHLLFDDDAPHKDEAERVIVLMTDGAPNSYYTDTNWEGSTNRTENTSYFYINAARGDTESVRETIKRAAAIADTGVSIYTVGYNVSNMVLPFIVLNPSQETGFIGNNVTTVNVTSNWENTTTLRFSGTGTRNDTTAGTHNVDIVDTTDKTQAQKEAYYKYNKKFYAPLLAQDLVDSFKYLVQDITEDVASPVTGNVVITDVIGSGFKPILPLPTPTVGEVDYDSGTNTVTWTIPAADLNLLNPTGWSATPGNGLPASAIGPNVYTFEVRAIGEVGDDKNEDGGYVTNNEASSTFTPSEDNEFYEDETVTEELPNTGWVKYASISGTKEVYKDAVDVGNIAFFDVTTLPNTDDEDNSMWIKDTKVLRGEYVVYRIVLTRSGAAGRTITVPFKDILTFAGAGQFTENGTWLESDNRTIGTMDDMNNKKYKNITFTSDKPTQIFYYVVKLDEVGFYTNAIYLNSDPEEDAPTDTATVTVDAHDISVSKLVYEDAVKSSDIASSFLEFIKDIESKWTDKTRVKPGSQVIYKITVELEGDKPVFIDSMDDILTYMDEDIGPYVNQGDWYGWDTDDEEWKLLMDWVQPNSSADRVYTRVQPEFLLNGTKTFFFVTDPGLLDVLGTYKNNVFTSERVDIPEDDQPIVEVYLDPADVVLTKTAMISIDGDNPFAFAEGNIPPGEDKMVYFEVDLWNAGDEPGYITDFEDTLVIDANGKITTVNFPDFDNVRIMSKLPGREEDVDITGDFLAIINGEANEGVDDTDDDVGPDEGEGETPEPEPAGYKIMPGEILRITYTYWFKGYTTEGTMTWDEYKKVITDEADALVLFTGGIEEMRELEKISDELFFQLFELIYPEGTEEEINFEAIEAALRTIYPEDEEPIDGEAKEVYNHLKSLYDDWKDAYDIYIELDPKDIFVDVEYAVERKFNNEAIVKWTGGEDSDNTSFNADPKVNVPKEEEEEEVPPPYIPPYIPPPPPPTEPEPEPEPEPVVIVDEEDADDEVDEYVEVTPDPIPLGDTGYYAEPTEDASVYVILDEEGTPRGLLVLEEDEVLEDIDYDTIEDIIIPLATFDDEEIIEPEIEPEPPAPVVIEEAPLEIIPEELPLAPVAPGTETTTPAPATNDPLTIVIILAVLSTGVAVVVSKKRRAVK